MEITFDKKQYDKYFEEFKRKHAFVAKEAISYSIESYDTIKIYLESGDSILYNVNNDNMDYIHGEIKEGTKKKRGRPVSRNPNNIMFSLRMSQSLQDKLKFLCDYNNKESAEMIRQLIEDAYHNLYSQLWD